MQSHDNDQRAEAIHPDGRRDAERSAVQAPCGVAYPQVPDPADGQVRVVNLSANLVGRGGAAA